METRFGIVLLVIVAMVGFMIGRSAKIQFAEKRTAAVELATTGGALKGMP